MHSLANSHLNAVSVSVIQSWAEEDWFRDIQDLDEFLLGLDKIDTPLSDAKKLASVGTVRFAPSIVGRSEAELFGVSVPRFVWRISLRDGLSFVNARRLRTFIASAQYDNDREWGDRIEDVSRQIQGIRKDSNKPLDELIGETAIADCVLIAPKRLSHYKIVKAPLLVAYGETLSMDRLLWGTPFMKCINLGGGLCSQASCFMASALLHQHASGVFGLAEISTYAADPRFDEVCLSGLTNDQISNFFDRINLNGTQQKVHPSAAADFIARNDVRAKSVVEFESVLRGYLLSNIPLILPTDQRRLAGKIDIPEKQSIYYQNDLNVASEFLVHKPYPHSVVLVACSIKPEEHSFLINDPSAFPFLTASAEQIAEIGADYATPASTDEWPFETRDNRSFISVTPKAVRLALSWWREPNQGAYLPGLAQIAHEDNPLLTKILPDVPLHLPARSESRSFLLTTVGELGRRKASILSNLSEFYVEGLKPEFDRVAEELKRHLGWSDKHWVWVHTTKEAIWFHDAEQALPTDAKVYYTKRFEGTSADANRAFLRCLLYLLDLKATVTLFKPQGLAQSSEDDTARYVNKSLANLRPSLISSFSVNGIKEAAAHWPSAISNVELYAFMQADADILPDILAPSRDRIKRHTAAEKMAALLGNDGLVSLVADRINNAFNGKQIVAIATFLPELMAMEKNTDAWKTAQEALKFLIQLSRDLNSRFSHKIETIELVAGSRIDGIWRGIRQSDFVYVANKLQQEKVFDRFFERIESVAEFAAKDQKIQLAVELEPGPLFCLDNRDNLELFCSRLASHKTPMAIRQTVGLNLDIPHWALLSGIDVDWVTAHDHVRSSIIHAHISDHSSGHFGDNVLTSINPVTRFKPWLNLLSDLQKERGRRSLTYSGFVSCELEACKNAAMVAECSAKLVDLLR